MKATRWIVIYDSATASLPGHIIKEARQPYVPVALVPDRFALDGNSKQRAAAQLIGTAPQLLQACLEALEHVEANSNGADAANIIKCLRRAIRKATEMKP